LIIAAGEGYAAVVEILINAKANVHSPNNAGRTALHVAASYGHLEVVALLLEAGARANARDALGETPLHVAANPTIVDELLKARANLAIRNYGGRTALFAAVERDDANVVRSMVHAGADVNLLDRYWETSALRYSAYKGSVGVVAALLESETLGGTEIQSALVIVLNPMLAQTRGRREVRKLLEQASNDRWEKLEMIDSNFKLRCQERDMKRFFRLKLFVCLVVGIVLIAIIYDVVTYVMRRGPRVVALSMAMGIKNASVFLWGLCIKAIYQMLRQIVIQSIERVVNKITWEVVWEADGIGDMDYIPLPIGISGNSCILLS